MTDRDIQSIEGIYPDDWYFSETLDDLVNSIGVCAFRAPNYEEFEEHRLRDEEFFNRLLLSVRDLNQARSSATFLLEEVEWEDKYPLGELRRFQAYETSLIIAYARPFSQSRGQVPALSYGRLGIKLPPSVREIHEDLITKRNKLFAHSDADSVRHSNLWSYLGTRTDGSSFSVLAPPSFKEGTYLDLYEVYRVNNILCCLADAVFEMLQAMHRHFPDLIETRQGTWPPIEKD